MECSSSSRDSNSTSPYMENYSDDFQKCREIDFSETSSSSSESETIEHPSFTDPSETSQLEESVIETAVEIPVEEREPDEVPLEISVTPKVEPVFQTEQIQRRKKVDYSLTERQLKVMGPIVMVTQGLGELLDTSVGINN